MIGVLNNIARKHGRTLFAIFTVIIIVTFVGFLSPGNSLGCSRRYVVGEVYGKEVTAEMLQEFQRKLYPALLLQHFRNELDLETLFSYYAQFTKISRLGIVVSDKEAGTFVAAHPYFQKDGKFDTPAYEKFLKDNSIRESDLAESVKIVLSLNKFFTRVRDLASVTDDEVLTRFRQERTGYTVKVAEVPADSFKIAAPEEAELKEFYTKNQQKYRQAGYFQATYVEISPDDFAKESEKLVTAKEVSDLYARLGDGMKHEDGKPMTKAEAEKQIREYLVHSRGMELARTKAAAFDKDLNDAVSGVEGRQAQIAAFTKVAGKNGLTVKQSGKVTFNSFMIGKTMAPTLVRALQSMPQTGLPVTRTLMEQSGVFLCGCLQERHEERQKSFDEVRKEAAADWTAEKRWQQARAAVEQSAKNIEKCRPEHKLKAFNHITGAKYYEFAVQPDREPAEAEAKRLAPEIAAALPELAAGEYSGPIRGGKGMLLVRVNSRQVGKLDDFESRKEELKSRLQQEKSYLLLQALGAEVQANCRLNSEIKRPAK